MIGSSLYYRCAQSVLCQHGGGHTSLGEVEEEEQPENFTEVKSHGKNKEGPQVAASQWMRKKEAA